MTSEHPDPPSGAGQASGPTPERVSDEVREAVDRGADVRAEVERITREALAGRFDLERVRAVVRAVGEGIAAGASAHPDRGRRSVAEAVEGLERALAESALAARLAVEESASRVAEYGEGELRRALRELANLESMMLDTLQQAAAAGRSTGARALGDLVEHARRTGTRVGEEVERSLRELTAGLPEALRETTLVGLDTMREAAARAAEVASGVFEGLAKALRETGQPRAAGDRAAAGGPVPADGSRADAAPGAGADAAPGTAPPPGPGASPPGSDPDRGG